MNKDTFTLMVKEYKTMVRSAILKTIPSLSYDGELDDLEQEAWAKAWESRDQYDPEKSQVQTWLHRIATSVAIDYLRAQAAQKRPTLVLRDTVLVEGGAGLSEVPYYEAPPAASEFGSDAMPPHAPSAEEECVAIEKSLAMRARVDDLSAQAQHILSLAYDEDYSAREIAEEMGLGYDNVRQILARSRSSVTR